MIDETSNAEYLRARETAAEYRRMGYEVAREAPLDFLPGFRADLVVRKDDEVKVIEVKSRSSLAADPREPLAKLLALATWRSLNSPGEHRLALAARGGTPRCTESGEAPA